MRSRKRERKKSSNFNPEILFFLKKQGNILGFSELTGKKHNYFVAN